MKNAFNKSLFIGAIIFVVFAFGANQANAQSQKVNSAIEQSNEQPPAIEIPVPKKQVVIGLIVTAGISICEQYNGCRKVLNIFRDILTGGQPSVSPQIFNQPRRISTIGNGQKFKPF